MHALASDPGGDPNACHDASRSTAFQHIKTVGFHLQFPEGLSFLITTILISGLNMPNGNALGHKACILDPPGFGLPLPVLPSGFTTALPAKL